MFWCVYLFFLCYWVLGYRIIIINCNRVDILVLFRIVKVCLDKFYYFYVVDYWWFFYVGFDMVGMIGCCWKGRGFGLYV